MSITHNILIVKSKSKEGGGDFNKRDKTFLRITNKLKVD